MSEVKWTRQQRLAIEAEGADVLVTAAAGSGKTAVLAERCVHLLATGRCEVEGLVVVTFTEAAAAEMKARIGRRLGEECRKQRGNEQLRRQMALLERGPISTIHSLCRGLVREFFYHVEVDPAAEVLAEDEAGLLRSEVLAEVLEDAYAGKERSADLAGKDRGQDARDTAAGTFRQLAQQYAGRVDERGLVYAVTRAHNFLDAVGNRAGWLERCGALRGEGAESALVRAQQAAVREGLADVEAQLGHALVCMEHLAGAEHYREDAVRMLAVVEEVREWLERNGDRAMERLGETGALGSLRRRKAGESTEGQEVVKGLLDEAKKAWQGLAGRLACSGAAVAKQWAATAESVSALLRVQEEFRRRYQERKARQGLLDFSDLEHKCLELLEGPAGETVRGQLQRRYRYVLVDEYQDISPVQERILGHIRQAGERGNVFAVGDVKQSIYGFRQAQPSIFLEKFARSEEVAGDLLERGGQLERPGRVSLNVNFRSRREIVAGVNRVFERCMTEELGGLDYATYGRLEYGAGFLYGPADEAAEMEEDKGRVEVHLIEEGVGGKDVAEVLGTLDMNEAEAQARALDAGRREAVVVARRLRAIMGLEGDGERLTVVDKDTKQHRPMEWRDCVVLLRAARVAAQEWAGVFEAMGIPVHAEQNTGYFEATEVQDVLSLLRVLDNGQQDIELAAVLRGPIGGFAEEELAAVRAWRPKGAYHQAVAEYALEGPDEILQEKLRGLLGRLDDWRTVARRRGVAHLLWEVYRETQLPAWVRGLPSGRQRWANLLALHDRARQFDSFATQGLGRFVEFLERLGEEEGDYGPAPLVSEAEDVVRIMTVHKSKGLEFPVVVLAGLGKGFHRGGRGEEVLFEEGEWPVGAKWVEPVTRERWLTVGHEVLARRRWERETAEELRVLYVAMTRARERLVLVGSGKLADWQTKWQTWRNHEGPLPRFALTGAGCFLEWIGAALAGHQDMAKLWDEETEDATEQEEARYRVVVHGKKEVAAALAREDVRHVRRGEVRGIEERIGNVTAEPPAQAKAVMERLEWRYPWEAQTRLGARATVTELKKRFGQETEEEEVQVGWQVEASEAGTLRGAFARRPGWLTEETARVGATETGTWTHMFLERVDLKGRLEEAGLTEQLAGFVRAGVLDERAAGTIEIGTVAKFFASELGRAMAAARDVEREWAFTLALPVGLVYPEAQATAEHERVLVRGVIDCLFDTPEGPTIVDFKTDRVWGEALAARAAEYEGQLRLYARAVEMILGRPVHRMALCFLEVGETVEVV